MTIPVSATLPATGSWAIHIWRIRKQRMMGYAALTHPTLATLAFFIFINQAPAKASTLQPSDWDYAHCSLSSKEQEDMPAINRSQIQVLGKNLREDLNRTYDKISNGAIEPIPKNERDTTSVVLKYIKIGMKFSDAESILSIAGFSVDIKPEVLEEGGNTGQKFFFIGAEIAPFSQHIVSRTDLIIILYPQKNSDFSQVCELSATFLEDTL